MCVCAESTQLPRESTPPRDITEGAGVEHQEPGDAAMPDTATKPPTPPKATGRRTSVSVKDGDAARLLASLDISAVGNAAPATLMKPVIDVHEEVADEADLVDGDAVESLRDRLDMLLGQRDIEAAELAIAEAESCDPSERKSISQQLESLKRCACNTSITTTSCCIPHSCGSCWSSHLWSSSAC